MAEQPEQLLLGYVPVMSDDALAEGQMVGVDVQGERVLLVRTQGRLHAVGGLCTHQIAPLEEGYLEGRTVTCPRHGAAFDLATGEALGPPSDMPLPVYEVRALAGRIWVSPFPRSSR